MSRGVSGTGPLLSEVVYFADAFAWVSSSGPTAGRIISDSNVRDSDLADFRAERIGCLE